MLPKLLFLCFLLSPINGNYLSNRELFILLEEDQMLGSNISLKAKEVIVNRYLMSFKLEEYDAGFKEPGIFGAGRHFFHARDDIVKSKVFKFLKRLPKGAALHGHDTALASEEYVYKITFREGLYGCIVKERLKLSFLPAQKECEWKLIGQLRHEDPNFDEWLKSQLTLKVHNPRERYPNINEVWRTISEIFATVTPMLTFKPVFQEYFYQALQELYDDNVHYLEFRTTLPDVYDLNGTIYSGVEVAALYQEVIKEFKRDHPEFIGVKLIYAPQRSVPNETINNYISIVKDLKANHSELLAGFDLVGQEDIGRPLIDFVDYLKSIPEDVDFLFHAAETNWYGASTDLNLIDAILLGTKRIGHGYGAIKHPTVLEIVKKDGIAIEICPISNQVLMLVEDMRNHPGSFLLSQGYPVVVSYDDPSFWSTKGLSFDFYMAYMGMASRNADLRMLKQLAINSLIYSRLNKEEKIEALEIWKEQWDNFIDGMLNEALKEAPIHG